MTKFETKHSIKKTHTHTHTQKAQKNEKLVFQKKRIGRKCRPT